MDISPLPFLRLGIAILGLSVAFAVWVANGGWPDGLRLAAGIVAGFAVMGVGEAVVRRLLAAARPAPVQVRASRQPH